VRIGEGAPRCYSRIVRVATAILVAVVLVGCRPTEQGLLTRIEPVSAALANPLRVSRTAFEERPDMVLVEGIGVCALFDPRSCDLVMAWRGSVERLGKVHDFSQATSRPRIADRDGVLVDYLDDALIADDASLSTARPSLEASVDLRGSSDAWLWFEERGRTPVRLDLVCEGGAGPAACFESACHVTSETEWQWNLKRLPRCDGVLTMRLSCATHPKEVRGVRVLRELVAWRDSSGVPLHTRWRGYSLDADGSVRLAFDLARAGERPVLVEQRLSPRADGGIDTAFVGTIPSDALLHLEVPRARSLAGAMATP